MKHTLLLSLALCSAITSFAQRADEKVTSLLNNYIHTQNKYSTIQKDFKGVYISVDPITDYEDIRYREGVDAATKKAFEKYSREEQLQIVTSKPIPVGQTLTIYDTSGFFKQPMYTFKDGPAIKVVSTTANETSDDYVRFTRFNHKGTDVLVFIYLDKEGNFYNYSLRMDEQPLALKEMPIR